MDGHTYPVDDQMLNYTLYQPVGVCALVSPWNVPFMTATWKTAPCLALGNTAVLKMSELSPLTANRSEEHTSELQSLMRISYAVFCLKKKTKKNLTTDTTTKTVTI